MTMNGLNVVALSQGGGPIADVARTFGVDWPHLIAQTISFGIVCTVLYLLAYRPILRMLADARREVGRLVLQTSAAVVGKILTAEDHRRLADETARRLGA
jgi:F0F1-type ATP synthase membrane subunit b/b'